MTGGGRLVGFDVSVDGERVASETIALWPGRYVLTVSTTLNKGDLVFELISTFAGYRGLAMYATHLALGPIGYQHRLSNADYEHRALEPMLRARECAYEHIQVLVEHLTEHGYEVSIEMDDDAFEVLERVQY